MRKTRKYKAKAKSRRAQVTGNARSRTRSPVDSQRSLAAEFGVALSTLQLWAARGAPLDQGRDAFEAFRAAAKAGNPETTELRNELYRERINLSRTENEVRRTKLGKMSGELITVGEALAEIENVVLGWVSILRIVPVEITNLIPDSCPHCGHVMGLREALRPEITRMIHRVLSEMEAHALKGTAGEKPVTPEA